MNRLVSTRSGRRRRVLLAMGFISPERQAGIVRYAREAGWIVDWSLPQYHAAGHDQQYLEAGQYDGVVALCSKASPWLPDLLRKFTIPVVDMWADYPQEPFPRVLLDNVAIGYAAARHLLARGFKHLLFYTHAIETRPATARLEGFTRAAREAGAQVGQLNWDHRIGPHGRQARVAWLARRLEGQQLPLAVMGSNDTIACEVLEAAELAGLKVPQQVAVIGVDNDPAVTELALVPLSSVDPARERAGYVAATLLDRLMDGVSPPKQPILIPPGPVIARRSTDALAVRDPRVAAAIQFIHDHFHEPITADQIAAHAGVSRRWLQSRILIDSGRTIHQMILGQRIEQAQRLLVGTRMKIELVAQRCGLGTGENLCKVFRRLLGTTPQQYRQRYMTSGTRAILEDLVLPNRTDELPELPMPFPSHGG